MMSIKGVMLKRLLRAGTAFKLRNYSSVIHPGLYSRSNGDEKVSLKIMWLIQEVYDGQEALYNGQVDPGNDRVPDGYGLMTYEVVWRKDRPTYSGSWKNGKRHGFGVFKDSDVTYIGKWNNDSQHGHGMYKWADGAVFEGSFVDGRRNGNGKLCYAKGGFCEGEWKNDAFIVGTKCDNKGNTYTGGFKNDQYEGQGSLIQTDLVYTGLWADGKRNGLGVTTLATGDVLEGLYLEDQLNGPGRANYANSGATYEGNFVHDQRCGRGKMVYANGDVYEGDWVEGERHGQGRLSLALGGGYFEGQWVRDVPQKQAILQFV